MDGADDKDLYSGLVRLHILHHACQRSVFGFGMVEELSRHGYRMSTGTLYPILHGLERRGYLRSRVQRDGRTVRRMYKATKAGRRAFLVAKGRVLELFRELFEEGHPR